MDLERLEVVEALPSGPLAPLEMLRGGANRKVRGSWGPEGATSLHPCDTPPVTPRLLNTAHALPLLTVTRTHPFRAPYSPQGLSPHKPPSPHPSPSPHILSPFPTSFPPSPHPSPLPSPSPG